MIWIMAFSAKINGWSAQENPLFQLAQIHAVICFQGLSNTIIEAAGSNLDSNISREAEVIIMRKRDNSPILASSR